MYCFYIAFVSFVILSLIFLFNWWRVVGAVVASVSPDFPVFIVAYLVSVSIVWIPVTHLFPCSISVCDRRSWWCCVPGWWVLAGVLSSLFLLLFFIVFPRTFRAVCVPRISSFCHNSDFCFIFCCCLRLDLICPFSVVSSPCAEGGFQYSVYCYCVDCCFWVTLALRCHYFSSQWCFSRMHTERCHAWIFGLRRFPFPLFVDCTFGLVCSLLCALLSDALFQSIDSYLRVFPFVDEL